MTIDLGHEPVGDVPGMQKEALRQRLTELGERRGDHHELAVELDLQSGATLLEVRDTPDLSYREASELLGISRQQAYNLMERARKAGRG